MTELSALQCRYRDLLISFGIGGSAYLPTLLLIGPTGAGKRTIARAAAETLGMDFVDVRVDGIRKGVEEMLFGTALEAQAAEHRHLAPGLLGGASPTLIYLSGIENLDPGIWNSLSSVVTNKIFRDVLGNSWHISADAWVVGGLKTSSNDSLIGPEHWLCAAFDQRAWISPPMEKDDLLTICGSILSEHPVTRTLDSSLADFFAGNPSIPDHLHSIRRWIEIAGSPDRAMGPLTRSDLEIAMVEDLQWVLARLSYRGANLTPSQFSRWADQFGRDLRPLAAHLVRHIADRYFIGYPDFYRLLDELIARSRISQGHSVAFCKWEALGKSSPRVAHAMKNQARWKVLVDIDLSKDPRSWPDLRALGVRHVVLADDFVGSGKTLSKLFFQGRGPLALLLQANAEIVVYILLIAGFEGGLRNIKSSIPIHLLKRIRIITGRLFDSHDQCFETKSRILPFEEQRKALRQFCLDVAATHYPRLHPDSRLGFGEIGALVVFPDTVPNNSLPILWHDTGTWRPLFPASGISSS